MQSLHSTSRQARLQCASSCLLVTFCSFSQIKTFNEACLMVRKPALELFAYLKNSNFAHPAVRYVICIFYRLLGGTMHVKYEQASSRRWR